MQTLHRCKCAQPPFTGRERNPNGTKQQQSRLNCAARHSGHPNAIPRQEKEQKEEHQAARLIEPTRRQLLFVVPLAVSGLAATASADAQSVDASSQGSCRECAGSGIVACDMCGGTGKWRALSRKRVKDTYEFAECPQCYGRGVRICGRCFGTGAQNVRGLLRRPEATLLVQKMQKGELQPGEVRGLLQAGKEQMMQEQQQPAQ